jgi:hypothetical protein
VATAPRLRAAAFAGLATVSAALAHGNLGHPVWLLAAAAGALIATAVPAALTSRVVRGDPFAALPLPLVAAWMLAAQGIAHLVLETAGASPHAGATGSLALHVVLAVVSAALIRRLELRLAALQSARLALFTEPVAELRRRCPRNVPRSLWPATPALGRAPPRVS